MIVSLGSKRGLSSWHVLQSNDLRKGDEKFAAVKMVDVDVAVMATEISSDRLLSNKFGHL
jgi:hypothetical protein